MLETASSEDHHMYNTTNHNSPDQLYFGLDK